MLSMHCKSVVINYVVSYLREWIGIDTILDDVDDARAESPESVCCFRRLLHCPDCSLCSSQLLITHRYTPWQLLRFLTGLDSLYASESSNASKGQGYYNQFRGLPSSQGGYQSTMRFVTGSTQSHGVSRILRQYHKTPTPGMKVWFTNKCRKVVLNLCPHFCLR